MPNIIIEKSFSDSVNYLLAIIGMAHVSFAVLTALLFLSFILLKTILKETNKGGFYLTCIFFMCSIISFYAMEYVEHVSVPHYHLKINDVDIKTTTDENVAEHWRKAKEKLEKSEVEKWSNMIEHFED